MQSEFIAIRASGCFAINSLIDARRHGLWTTTTRFVAINAISKTNLLQKKTIFVIFLNRKQVASKDSIETLSALEIAEQMTYLDHQIFMNIRSE